MSRMQLEARAAADAAREGGVSPIYVCVCVCVCVCVFMKVELLSRMRIEARAAAVAEREGSNTHTTHLIEP